MRLAVRQAISDPLHEGRIEASGFVVWIAWDSWQTGPLIGSLAKHAIFPTGASRPVEAGCILRDEAWPRPRRSRNLARHQWRDDQATRSALAASVAGSKTRAYLTIDIQENRSSLMPSLSRSPSVQAGLRQRDPKNSGSPNAGVDPHAGSGRVARTRHNRRK